MRAAHKGMNIKQNEFDQTWKNLKEALDFYKVKEELIEEVKEVFHIWAKDRIFLISKSEFQIISLILNLLRS